MKNVLITGCSSGFGLMSAIELAKRGHRVFATMRNLGKSGTLEEAAKAEGVDIEIGPLDVTSDESARAAVDHVLSSAGRIDALVNNAGLGSIGPFEDYSEDELRALFETNFFGAVRMMKAVLPSMRDQGSGVIVNVSSISGLFAAPFFGPYAATKYALEAISESAAWELEPFGVWVTLVEPGRFNTGIMGNELSPSGFGESSPYWERGDRMRSKFQREIMRAPDGRAVAEKIAEAIESPERKVRHLVGEDAELVMEARKTMSDEEFGELTKRVYKI
jgi:NAD(P)-dependent dehydrogenase (short-subunit alcohol dehydrogenase family)